MRLVFFPPKCESERVICRTHQQVSTFVQGRLEMSH
jgi:hypothetical protein